MPGNCCGSITSSTVCSVGGDVGQWFDCFCCRVTRLDGSGQKVHLGLKWKNCRSSTQHRNSSSKNCDSR